MNKLIFLLFGLLTSLLFPPYFFTPLGFFIFSFICYFIDKNKYNLNKYQFFLYSFAFGFGFFISFLFWIQNPFYVFNETKKFFIFSIFLILILSLVFCIIFTILVKLNKILPVYFLVPIIFIIFEYVISIFIYGFPWVTFSLIISGNEFFSYSLKNFGTLVTSYIVIQIFCIPYIILSKQLKKIENFYFLLLFATPLILVLILNNFIFTNNDKENKISLKKSISVEIFQKNFETINKINSPSLALEKILKNIKNSKANLQIFAENNYPFLIKDLKLDEIQSILDVDKIVIIGGTRLEKDKYFNSLFNITSSNVDHFDKKILVPFGEFLPLRNILYFLKNISGPNDFTEGVKNRIIKLDSEYKYIPVICYEIIFYWKIINEYNFDSNFIINITNDIWFGNLLGPYQHFYITKLRAAEYNKPLIRVSNNGISGVFDQNGKILLSTNLNQEQNLYFNLIPNNEDNFIRSHFLLKIYLITILTFIIFLNLIKKNEYY